MFDNVINTSLSSVYICRHNGHIFPHVYSKPSTIESFERYFADFIRFGTSR